MPKYTELENSQSYFSDLYKDVNGFRPRWCTSEQWNSVEWLDAQIADLHIELEREMEREKAAQVTSILAFEARVDVTIAMGAGDRATALRWIFDAEEDVYCKNDPDYFCHCNNLPYGYFKEAA